MTTSLPCTAAQQWPQPVNERRGGVGRQELRMTGLRWNVRIPVSRPVLVEVWGESRQWVMKGTWGAHTKMGTMSQCSEWVESHMEEEAQCTCKVEVEVVGGDGCIREAWEGCRVRYQWLDLWRLKIRHQGHWATTASRSVGGGRKNKENENFHVGNSTWPRDVGVLMNL